MRFVVEGEPVGKSRPGTNKYGKRYAPPKSRNYEKRIRSAYIEAGGPYLDGPVQVHVEAYHKMPNGWSKKKQAEMEGTPCLKKPDADNILKSVLDGLQGAAFEDDKAVYCCSSVKVWSRFGFVVVDVTKG